MTNRGKKERKLVALMVKDLELNLGEQEMADVQEEVRVLPDEELDRTLSGRLDLPYPVDEKVLEQALSRVEEPKRPPGGEPGYVAEAPDTSQEPHPEEREG